MLFDVRCLHWCSFNDFSLRRSNSAIWRWPNYIYFSTFGSRRGEGQQQLTRFLFKRGRSSSSSLSSLWREGRRCNEKNRTISSTNQRSSLYEHMNSSFIFIVITKLLRVWICKLETTGLKISGTFYNWRGVTSILFFLSEHAIIKTQAHQQQNIQ